MTNFDDKIRQKDPLHLLASVGEEDEAIEGKSESCSLVEGRYRG